MRTLVLTLSVGLVVSTVLSAQQSPAAQPSSAATTPPGTGSQMLQPLAIAVIGGIAASIVLSLIVAPAVHYYLQKTEA